MRLTKGCHHIIYSSNRSYYFFLFNSKNNLTSSNKFLKTQATLQKNVYIYLITTTEKTTHSQSFNTLSYSKCIFIHLFNKKQIPIV